MKSALSDSTWRPAAWAAALVATLILLVGAVLPPFVGPGWEAVLRVGFGTLCHQFPARSFTADGIPFAVCHRCTGIYAGLVLGALALPALRSRAHAWAQHDRWLLLAAVVPLLLDWGIDVLGIWTNTVGTRISTGLWFGLVAGFIFARSVSIRAASPVAG